MKSILPLSVALALSACTPTSQPDDAATPVQGPVVGQAPVAAPGKPPLAPEAAVEMLHYQCGDLLVSLRNQSNGAQLSFSGRELILPHVPADSGAKYDDGNGNSLWTRGEDATFMLAGSDQGTCKRSGRASPWMDAQSRGIGFRAVGSEPGWYVEVGRGEAPKLHALVDYGERKIDVANAEHMSGGFSGFRGTASDGTAIELRITQVPCNDGMSGEAFEASAELLVADRSYEGCGAYLYK